MLPPYGCCISRAYSSFAPYPTQCLQMVDEFKGAKGGMESKFNEKACECMGCCPPESEDDPPCFFPVWSSAMDNLGK